MDEVGVEDSLPNKRNERVKMPRYDFKCSKCNKITELFVPVEEVKVDGWNRNRTCPECNGLLEQAFLYAPGIIWKGAPSAGQLIRNKKDALKAEAIYNEGFTSESEVKEAMDIAKEYEKDKGLKPGSLTTGVKAPITKEQKAKARETARKKRAEGERQRRKSLK